MRFPARDGTPLAARVVGTGDVAVLLISGGPGCVNYLPDPPPGLVARVVAPDPRGVGRSGGGPHGLHQSLDDLEALREHLDVGRWVVVGHSSGADLGLAYAAEHPDAVAHLVSVCGTGLQDDRSWHAAYVERRHEEPDLDLAWVPEVHAALLAGWRDWIRSPDLYDRIREVSCDVTVVAAEHDIRPSWPLAQLAVLLRTTLQVLPGVGHDLWHTHPDLWWELVEAATREHRPAAPTTAEQRTRALEDRRHLLSALARSLGDPHRLVDLVADTDDVEDAVARLGAELGLDEHQARAVLDLQVRRLTRRARGSLREELAELEKLAPDA